jgi:hypothetical protein
MDNDTATGREWAGLAVLALPTLLVSIDIFVLLLALPRLGQDLRASATQKLWISESRRASRRTRRASRRTRRAAVTGCREIRSRA